METDVQTMPEGMKNHLKAIVEKQAAQTSTATKAEETVEAKEEEVKEVPTEEVVKDAVVVAETETTKEEEPPAVVENDLSWMEAKKPIEAPTESALNDPERIKDINKWTIEDKAKTFDGLMADKEVQFFLEARRAGKSLLDITSELELADYSKMNDAEVAQHYGTLRGLSDEDIEMSIDALDDKTPIEKRDLIDLWKERLAQSQSAKLDKIAGDWKSQVPDTEAISQKFEADVKEKQALIMGKNFFGAVFNEKDADNFGQWVRTVNTVNPDGSPNMDHFLKAWLAEQLPNIQKANFAKGETKGKKEVLEAVHRPSESSASASRPPAPAPKPDKRNQAVSAVQQIFGGKR